jgi:hypothetical protein|tara:strand:+ start:102 stop:380 length:279 start_codon:yes stop_codon:yes gene_type:complete
MSYVDIIKSILSDGRWHCIESIIQETGYSARNRISEMNKASMKKDGRNVIDGEPCDLENHSHKANVYKYRNAQHEEKEYYMQTFDDLIGETI